MLITELIGLDSELVVLSVVNVVLPAELVV